MTRATQPLGSQELPPRGSELLAWLLLLLVPAKAKVDQSIDQSGHHFICQQSSSA